MEEWKQIQGAKEGYKISNLARAITPNGRILKPILLPIKGYKNRYFVYKFRTIDEGNSSSSISKLMYINFPDIDLNKIAPHYIGKHQKINKSIDEIVNKIKQNTTPKNIKINNLIIDFLQKGDHRFGAIVNECNESFRVIASKRFDILKKKYCINIDKSKVEIAETAEDLIQEYYIKLMRDLKDGRFDGRLFFAWTKTVIKTEVLMFFINRAKEINGKIPKPKKTKEENLLKQKIDKSIRKKRRQSVPIELRRVTNKTNYEKNKKLKTFTLDIKHLSNYNFQLNPIPVCNKWV